MLNSNRIRTNKCQKDESSSLVHGLCWFGIMSLCKIIRVLMLMEHSGWHYSLLLFCYLAVLISYFPLSQLDCILRSALFNQQMLYDRQMAVRMDKWIDPILQDIPTRMPSGLKSLGIGFGTGGLPLLNIAQISSWSNAHFLLMGTGWHCVENLPVLASCRGIYKISRKYPGTVPVEKMVEFNLQLWGLIAQPHAMQASIFRAVCRAQKYWESWQEGHLT